MFPPRGTKLETLTVPRHNVLVKLNVYSSSVTRHYTPMLLKSLTLGNKKQASLNNHDTHTCVTRDSLAEAMLSSVMNHHDVARTVSQRRRLRNLKYLYRLYYRPTSHESRFAFLRLQSSATFKGLP